LGIDWQCSDSTAVTGIGFQPTIILMIASTGAENSLAKSQAVFLLVWSKRRPAG